MSISPVALINHRLERGIECVLHGEITRLSRSICRDQGNDIQGVTNPLSHKTLLTGVTSIIIGVSLLDTATATPWAW